MFAHRDYTFIVCLIILFLSTTGLIFLVYHSHADFPNAVHDAVTRVMKPQPKLAGTFPKAAVACDAPLCADIAGEILHRRNGSAVDAAIAALFCMGLVIPESTGLGGGGWFTIFSKSTGKVTIINSRETAPSYADARMFDGSVSSRYGVDAIAIPGELAGYHEAHQRFGRLPFRDLIQPTIDLAHKGFPVGKHLSDAINLKIPTIRKYGSQGIKTFIKPPVREKFMTEGDIMRREDLALTLEIIQQEGVASFYNGTLAKKLISDLRSLGSRMTLEDLANYSARVEESEGRLLANGMTFYSNNLPGSGPLMGFMLDAVMRSLNLTEKLTEADMGLFYRNTIEVMKFAFGQRSFLGDPVFEEGVNCSRHETTYESMQRINSPLFSIKVAERIKSMNKTCCDPAHYQQALGFPVVRKYLHFRPDQGTAAVTVIDDEGNAVSAGSSINRFFGSLVMSPSTGIILNNQMDDFWMHASGGRNRDERDGDEHDDDRDIVYHSQHNEISAGKRPFSSMSPSIITTGRGKDQMVLMAISASGGTQITTAQSLVILRTLLFHDVSLEEAVSEARIHHQLQPNIVKFEERDGVSFPEAVKDRLLSFGHALQKEKGKGSAVVAIKRNSDGNWEAGTDWRKVGSVNGSR